MEQILQTLPARPQPVVVRYGVTAALVGFCFLVLLSLQRQGGLLGFYILFPAIFSSSVLFDRGSGIFGAVLSAAFLYFLLKPAGELLLPVGFALQLVLFVIVALGLAVVSEGLRTAWERALAAERTKDLLLRELGHRTSNNLAMVISILSLQARSKTDPELRGALEKAISRVQAIASAHEHFQPAMPRDGVGMRPYLEKLCRHLGDSLRDIRPIAITIEADDVHFPSEQAVSIGLIVNELVTNAFKHAFPDGRSGTVRVTLSDGPPRRLTVEDNGVGCPIDKKERLGSRLTRLLAEQLGAKLSWEETGSGCRVRLEFFPA
jgi:two-component sensor histidine kinase